MRFLVYCCSRAILSRMCLSNLLFLALQTYNVMTLNFHILLAVNQKVFLPVSTILTGRYNDSLSWMRLLMILSSRIAHKLLFYIPRRGMLRTYENGDMLPKRKQSFS